MKKNHLFIIIIITFAAISCNNVKSTEYIVNDGIKFCESTYPYNGGILIANFGGEELNPLNSNGEGYIMFYKGGKTEQFIAPDGNLNAPKGMYIKDNSLFICDVNKIVVYNLDSLAKAPQTIKFPEGDLFVNDLAASGNTLYASVTNTGKVYSINIENRDTLNNVTPQAWCDVIGANGLVINENSMYVASYPPDGVTTDKNVIYIISDLSNPLPEVFVNTPGQYDGLALSGDLKTMYVSNWNPAGVYTIDMATKVVTELPLERLVIGAADFTLQADSLYIPDLPNSLVIVKKAI